MRRLSLQSPPRSWQNLVCLGWTGDQATEFSVMQQWASSCLSSRDSPLQLTFIWQLELRQFLVREFAVTFCYPSMMLFSD